MQLKSLKIYSDGGARGNPGPASSAFVVFLDGKIIHREAHYLGIKTNNEAEYSGICQALDWVKKYELNGDISLVNFFLDSELVAKQLSGEYKVKNENLKKYFLTAKKSEKELLKNIFYTPIAREKNKVADKMVNEELDRFLNLNPNEKRQNFT